jgi:hypothetical protein
MKLFSAFTILLFFSASSFAQHINAADRIFLQQKEDSLKSPALQIIQGRNAADRFIADSNFTRTFIRALKTPYSFNYRFDSLETISRLYAPDSSFRIFTWQMVINENIIRQHGAIQMKTSDGSLKLFPLIDKSDITSHMEDTIGNNFGWMGAVYYKIIPTKFEGRSYYTLLGYDANNIRSEKKIIEVLSFVNNAPVFGGRYFSIASGEAYQKNIARYVMEFKKEASPRLTYDADLNMIIMEHLVSESNQPNKKWTMIPDGDYEGFKWVNGKWTYVKKIFNTITTEGNEPVPAPVLQTKEMASPGSTPKKKGGTS